MEYQSIESEKKRKDLVRSETLTIFVEKKQANWIEHRDFITYSSFDSKASLIIFYN